MVTRNGSTRGSRRRSLLGGKLRGAQSNFQTDGRWIEQVAGSTGLSISILQQLVDLADAGSFGGTAPEVVTALLRWLANQPTLLTELVRPESLEGLFGEQFKRLPSDAHRARQALNTIGRLLPLWMSGVPLCELEAAFLEGPDQLRQCDHARHFVSRIVPDLAFMAGLPGRLLAVRGKQAGDATPLPTVLATLGSIVREGTDSPEALATRINCGRSVSRVGARRIFDKIKNLAPNGEPTENFEETRSRMRAAGAILS